MLFEELGDSQGEEEEDGDDEKDDNGDRKEAIPKLNPTRKLSITALYFKRAWIGSVLCCFNNCDFKE